MLYASNFLQSLDADYKNAGCVNFLMISGPSI